MRKLPDFKAPWRKAQSLLGEQKGALLPVAAVALIAILGMLGSGLDLGRAYMAKARLQQACDAGVLAGRAELSVMAWDSGAKQAANAIFDENFPTGKFGATDLVYKYQADSAKHVTGVATATMNTTLMRIFGKKDIPISAACSAETQMPNVDVMFVLDTTGSMNSVNPGDSKNRIGVLRDAVQSFYTFVEGNKVAGAQTRYGFVPFSTNVNVGHLLKPEWIVDSAAYQSRRFSHIDNSETRIADISEWGGWTASGGTEYTTFTVLTGEGACIPPPQEGWSTTSSYGTPTVTYDEFGREIEVVTVTDTQNGTTYWVDTSEGECRIYKSVRNNYVETYNQKNIYYSKDTAIYWYGPINYNLAPLKANVSDGFLTGSGSLNVPIDPHGWARTIPWNGCIEERQTVNTTINGTIPTGAYDLDIDMIPSTDPATRWRPSLPGLIYARWDLQNWLSYSYLSKWHHVHIGDYDGGSLAVCPSKARRLSVMSASSLQDYLAGLQVAGTTYPDAGMIWGSRLLSGEGLFAADNQYSSNGGPIMRHLILMTDGQTEPAINAYTPYGYEPLDRRRTPVDHPPTDAELTDTVNGRFQAICAAARGKFTVWVIAFGTELTDNLKNCATPGSAFQANNASELNTAFRDISGRIANLRLTQ